MADWINRLRRFTAAVSAGAVLFAMVAGTWAHGAHGAQAAAEASPPCHEIANAPATGPDCEALCEVSSLSDVAIKLKAGAAGHAGLRPAALVILPYTQIAPVRALGQYWHPPALDPLAITQRRLI